MNYKLLVAAIVIFLSNQILKAQDTIGGIVWYPPIQISNEIAYAGPAYVAASGNDTIHITYFGGGKRLPYRRSTDGGRTFEPERELMLDTVMCPWFSAHERIVSSGDNVYIFFVNPRPPHAISKVMMMKSTDRGETFSTAREISPDSAGMVTTVAIHGDTVLVIYPAEYDARRKLLISTNGGQTWVKQAGLLNPYPPESEENNRICMTEGSLHMIEERAFNNVNEIAYLRSTNFGFTWIENKIISSSDGYFSDIPTISGYSSKCGTEILTAWRDTKYGVCGFAGASIISRIGIQNGKRWQPEVLLTNINEPKGFEAYSAINRNTKSVGWAVEYNCYDTIHTSSRSTTVSLTKFEPISDMTPAEFNAGNQSIIATSHAIHEVYQQEFPFKGISDFRVMYRRGEFIQRDVEFSLSSGVEEFDSTIMNETTTRTVTVYNSGKDVMIVGTAIADDLNFSIEPTSAEVNPFDSVHFLVKFTPTTKGTFTGKIIFYHNGKSSPDCIMVTGKGVWGNEKVTYEPGWQIVSIPVVPGPNQALPNMYSYDNGYVTASKMKFGQGYWAKPSETVFFQGGKSLSDSVSVKVGWNLIGALSEQMSLIELSSVPSSIIESRFYGYDSNGYYIADKLEPGFGYWVKVREDGKILLKAKMDYSGLSK